MTGAELVSRLQKVRGHGPHWTARCPAHEDGNPSLSINETVDKVLLKCHAGCTTEAVIGALGLSMTDLFAESKTDGHGERWDAARADRALWLRGLRRETLEHFRVVADLKKQAWSFPLGRGRPTKFKAFVPGERPKYWTEPGAPLGCYHLTACAGVPEAWLCEGEPDVWIAHQAHVTAFSLTGGAGNINDGCIDAIRAAQIGVVNVVYDRDDAGREGAKKVAEALLAAGQAVTVRELPASVGSGGDVTTLYNTLLADDTAFHAALDALPDGGAGHETTVIRNHRIRQAAIDTLTTPQQVGSWGWRDLETLVGPLVAGWSYAIGARSGNGKTTMLLNLLSRLRDDRVPTLYFGTEMPPDDLVKKWAAMRCGFDELRVFSGKLTEPEHERMKQEITHLTDAGEVTFSTTGRLDLKRLGSEILWAFDARTGPPPRVIVLDHLHRVTQEREGLEAVAKELKEIAKERRVAMLVACQLNREKDIGALDLHSPPSLSRYKGAAAIEEESDVALGLYRPLKASTTSAQRRAILRGQALVTEHEEPNTVAIMALKHRFKGKAPGRSVWLTVNGSRLESRAFQAYAPFDEPEHAHGDAWEAP